MDKTAQKKAQIRSFLRAIDIQVAEHGRALPKSIYAALARRGHELGINIEKDLDDPPTCKR